MSYQYLLGIADMVHRPYMRMILICLYLDASNSHLHLMLVSAYSAYVS